jgi:hypothetical protein
MGWTDRSDESVQMLVAAEVARRRLTGLPLPADAAHGSELLEIPIDDARRQSQGLRSHNDGQGQGGWGDAHVEGYYRIALRKEGSEPKHPEDCKCELCDEIRVACGHKRMANFFHPGRALEHAMDYGMPGKFGLR